MRIISIGVVGQSADAPGNGGADRLRPDAALFDREYGIYNDNFFKHALCNERKRTERSRRPFLLMLINIDRLRQCECAPAIVRELISVLRNSIRNIDLCGWYRHCGVIGVLFAEIGEQSARAAMETIWLKVHANLLRSFPLGIVNRIGVRFHFFPEQLDEEIDANAANAMFYPDISKEQARRRMALCVKRAIDIVGSIFCILLFSPVFLIVPLLIKLTSPGPVLFRQERIGLFGAKFVFLKFRSMYINNNDSIHREYIRKLIAGKTGSEAGSEEGKRIYKIKDDPRVTPLGRVLRKTSLDEIPQFFNVLKGEMSLVGPRPAIQYELDSYDIWHKHRLLHVKPGITGLWQIMGRSSTSFDEMVRLDLKYIREWTPWLDIKILLHTPLAVLRGKGAY